MAGKKQPYGINNIVSSGAAVVTVGLMFKILHCWAHLLHRRALTVEALLFLMLGFSAMKRRIDWTRVYPELNEDFSGELPKSSARAIGGGDNFSNTAALDKMLSRCEDRSGVDRKSGRRFKNLWRQG